jgi:hypothetical protein
MARSDPARLFEQDGFAVLPGYLSPDDLGPALGELAAVFPTAADFHDDVDPARNERFRDEFGGIVDFPFVSAELSLLRPTTTSPSIGTTSTTVGASPAGGPGAAAARPRIKRRPRSRCSCT